MYVIRPSILFIYLQHVNKTYKDLSARLGPHVAVQFEEDHISLDIPDHVTVVEGGWKIVPLTPPLVGSTCSSR